MDVFKKAHDYLGVTIEERKKLQIQYQQSADRGLLFIGQIITVSGVIAGFGFMAIGNITNKTLFVFGEFFLFLNICIGLYFIKKFWFEDLQGIRKTIKLQSLIADKLIKGLRQKNEESAKMGINELESFAKQENDLGKVFRLLPSLMIVFIMISAILLLSSFYEVESLIFIVNSIL